MPKFPAGFGNIINTPLPTLTATKTEFPIRGVFGNAAAAAGFDNVVKYEVTELDPSTVNESDTSQPTYHSTLFEAFGLNAVATYNFYVPTETTTFDSNVSSSLDELPRYVTLTWRTAPHRSVTMQSDKQVKPYLTPPTTPHPVVSFDIGKGAVSNGYVMPGSVSALITAPHVAGTHFNLDEDSFLLSPDSGGELAAVHVSDPTSNFTRPQNISSKPTRVTFVDPSIAGALNENRLQVSSQHTHLVVAAAVSKIISGLEVISEFNQDITPKNPPPTFPAPVDAPVVTYIGYVIERHDTSPDGSMKLGRVFNVESIDTGYLIDREVLYGARYSYRIRSLVQWVHSPTVSFEGQSTVDRQLPIDQAVGTKVASYYYGDWTDWAHTDVLDLVPPDPPDELIVQPCSRKGLIRVAWKMPNDPQRDINSMHLLRSTVQDGRVSDWSELGVFVPGNGAYDDRNVIPNDGSGTEYIYSMYSTSIHGQVSTLGEQVLARVVSDRISHEHELVRVSPAGADPTTHPSLGDPRESTDIIAVRRLTIFCRGGRSDHPLRDKDYLLDVKSLSTGERVQVSLNVDSTEIIPRDA